MTTLLVASTGGHLKQLHCLRHRLRGVGGPDRWATFDTPQARSLLDGEEVDYVPFVGGRDPLGVGRNVMHARRILRAHEIRTLVSTGSAVALPFFVAARARGLDCHYIESAARIEGPSVTGRLMTALRSVHRYTQYRSWESRHWRYGGSVFDAFEVVREAETPPRTIRRVVVTLGTYKGFGFRRLVERIIQILPAEVEVLWQTGETDVDDLPIDGRFAIPERELSEAMREADVVVAHAGVGAALAACEVGKCAILAPRRSAHREHVDDHQTQIATELSRQGLAMSVEADALKVEDLYLAAARTVRGRATPPPFEIATQPGL